MGVESDRYKPITERLILTDDSEVLNVQEITGKFDTPAAPTGDGTMIAIQKAIRDALITSGIVVSGSIGRTWILSDGTDSVTAVQGGTWTVQQGTPPWAVSQSGVWTTGRTWSLGSGTDSVSVPGIATAAKQDTQQARLDLLATETTLGDIETAIGAQSDAEKTDSTMSGSVVAWLKGIVKVLADVWDDALSVLSVKEIYRPSELRGRSHVDTALEFQTTDQTVHTVTAGKRFFLTTIGIVYLNDSPTTFGRLAIRDGAGGTIKIPYLSGIKSGGSGATATALANPTDFSEPIPFDTSVYVDILAGVITYSIFLIGYEEPT